MTALFRYAACLLTLAFSVTPLLAAGRPSAAERYWRDFKEYWISAFDNKNAVVMLTLAVGAVGIFIITRGKWRK